MSDEPKHLQDDKRIVILEKDSTRLQGVVFGNGDVGMGERLRHVEAAQETYERLRREDKEDATNAVGTLQEGMNRLRASLDAMRSTLDEQTGGWRVARIMGGVGVPLIVGLLIWIVQKLFTLTGGA